MTKEEKVETEEKVTNTFQSNGEKKKKNTVEKAILSGLCIFLCFLIAFSLGRAFLQEKFSQIMDKNERAIINKQEIVEYGSRLTYEAILEKVVILNQLEENTTVQVLIDNKELIQENEYIFDTVGDVTIQVNTITPMLIANFLRQNIITKKQIIWKVEDTKKPILSGVKDKEITKGETVDIKSGITAKDEVDGELTVTVEGKLDSNKVGEYTLTAKAVDKNQNEVTQTFKVIVKEENKKEETSKTNTVTSNKTTTNKKTNTTTTSKSTSKNSTSNKNASTGNSGKSSSSSSKNVGSNSNSTSTKAGRLALAKTEAKKVVQKIIKPGMTKLEKAKAICYYITNTVEVQNNQSTEAYKTNYGNEAYAALIMKIAACSGRCKAVTLLCDAAGLKSQHINQNQWTHQWNRIQIDDGSWITIDSQIGFVGDKHPLED